MQKNSRGFTLIELIGAIVILAVIALIAFPAIISVLDSGQTKVDSATKDLVISATNKYVSEHVNDFPKKKGSGANDDDTSQNRTYTNGNITTTELMENGYLEPTVYNKNCEIQDDYVTVTSNTKRYFYEYKVVDTNGACKK